MMVTHLIEIKYSKDTRPEQQLQAAHAQHSSLTQHRRRPCSSCQSLQCREVVYIPHTLVPLNSLNLDSQRATGHVGNLALKSLALKLDAHSVY